MSKIYKFKTEKYKELLQGRTVEWLANKLDYNNTTLYLLFNGRRTCKKPLAYAIVKILDKKNEVEDFFDKIEGD